MKKAVILILAFMLSAIMVSAHGKETFAEAEGLIESKISCDELTEGQLETIGDYYMEQMHPGESHGTMDEMMGGEGSEQLTQMHINMAKNFYCGEHEGLSEMMNMMMNGGMMSGKGMMDNSKMLGTHTGMSGGEKMMNMMSNYGWFGASLLSLIYWAIAAFVFSVIFWLTHNWLADTKHKR